MGVFMAKRMGVANIVNKKTGFKYTFRSTDLDNIFRKYILDLAVGKHHNKYLQNDYNNYGKNSFDLEIIKDNCKSQSELNRIGKLEITKNGDKSYNIIEGDVTFDGGGPTSQSPKPKDKSETDLTSIIDWIDDVISDSLQSPNDESTNDSKQKKTHFPETQKTRKCLGCGAHVLDFIKRCPHCNTVIQDSNEPIYKKVSKNYSVFSNLKFPKNEKTHKIIKLKRKKCVHCGRLLKINVKSCPYCLSTYFISGETKHIEENNESILIKNDIEINNSFFKRKKCNGCGRYLKCIVKRCPYCNSHEFMGKNCKKEKDDIYVENEVKELKSDEPGVIFRRKTCKKCNRKVKYSMKRCHYCGSTSFLPVKIYKKEDLPKPINSKSVNTPIINAPDKQSNKPSQRNSSESSSEEVQLKTSPNDFSIETKNHDNFNNTFSEPAQIKNEENVVKKVEIIQDDEIKINKKSEKTKGFFGRIRKLFNW